MEIRFPNPSDTKYRYNKYLTNLVFSVRTLRYGSSFFSPTIYGSRLGHNLRFMVRAWAINRRGKTRSVTYGTDLELGSSSKRYV